VLARIADSPTPGTFNAVILYGDRIASEDEFDFAWGAWRPDATSLGLVSLGSRPSVTVRTGVYNLVLDVRNRSTGQTVRVQRIAFVPQVTGTTQAGLPVA
jgi:hypothetical protein